MDAEDEAQGLLRGLVGDGRPALSLSGIALFLSGAFAVFLAAGLVILYLGTTEVFVAEDLGFMGVTREFIDGINLRLVPLIAHDRAGFGGGLATVGVLLLMCGWYAPPSRAFHDAVLVAGSAGFGCAIGTHFAEGYVNPVHLAPAFLGAALFAGSILCEITGRQPAARETEG